MLPTSSRPALTDTEALKRAHSSLEHLDVATKEFLFAAAAAGAAIRTQTRADVERMCAS